MANFPYQIQADNINAEESQATIMCHVFDDRSHESLCRTLCKSYAHVVSWDSEGILLFKYDNR